MKKTAVIVELDGNAVKSTAFGACSAIQGNDTYAFCVTPDAAPVAAELQKYGIKHVVSLSAPGVQLDDCPEACAAALAAALKHYGIVDCIAVNSPWGRDLMARVAAICNAALVTDCLSIDVAARKVTGENLPVTPSPHVLKALAYCIGNFH